MRHQLSAKEYAQLRLDMNQHQVERSPRYARALQSTNMLLAVLREFLPQESRCREAVEDHLMETFFYSNAAIINVPPEKDAMDKLALERAMLEPAAPLIIGQS